MIQWVLVSGCPSADIEARLKGEGHILPPLDHHQCRFGAWLDARSLSCGETDSALQAIQALHQQVHELAMELLELQAQD